jgi:ferritin-like metal-binding protein YciE
MGTRTAALDLKEERMAKGRELFEHGLRDMYDAEHRFVDALETMITDVSDSDLVDGFRRHLKTTKEQIRRLDRCFDEIDQRPSREDCPGSKGLIAEYKKFVQEEDPDPAVLNTFAAEAGQKIEHYEMVAYRSLVNLAHFLGYDVCAKQLMQNLAEEEQAAAELRTASEALAAKLTGAPAPDVMRRAAGTLMDQMREGALVTAGTAMKVGEYATRRTGEALERVEKRGRRAVRSARARGRSARAKTTQKSTGRARAAGRRKTTMARRRPTTARARTVARKTPRKTTRRTTARKRSPSRARSRS